MSLDNIHLPTNIIQVLFSKSLYDLADDKTVTAINPTGSIMYLGNNKKNILILVDSPEAVYLPDEELNFLMGILTACGLSMSDIALINYSKNNGLHYTDLTKLLNGEKILLFGLDPEKLGMPLQFPKYQIQNFNSQVYLASVTLKELQIDKEEKLKLWNCLKKVFSKK